MISTQTLFESDKMKYSPPYNKSEIHKFYPNIANKLLECPIHRWRAETGIELIHKEPTMEEQKRIWNNWQLMSSDMKRKSDNKSLELFKLTNEQHHMLLIRRLK